MTTHDPLLINVNLPLHELLKNASPNQLNMLVDIVTDKGKGRVSLNNDVKELLMRQKNDNTLHLSTQLLAREICNFGGNTLVNLVRTGTIDYCEVVKDVAKKLGAKVPKSTNLIEIEELVIRKALEKILQDKTSSTSLEQLCIQHGVEFDHYILEKLKQQGDISALAYSILCYAGPYAISNVLTAALMSGSGIAQGATLAMMGATTTTVARSTMLLNPVIAVLSATWLTYDLSGPAYRVTIPAVICIAAIRQEWCKSMTDYYCMELKKCLY
ncbi:hypothetical protein Q4R38_09950 [Morganella morganii]|nr:hypothetical protein [Morganella morganii]